jgi:Asp-tRNA(Asn)/Glu-tRNA(Gln) amidotransferase A subunit family amidase
MWDLTGMPVASIPVSWDVGVSLVAPRGREAMLVAAAAELQERALAVPAFSYGRG